MGELRFSLGYSEVRNLRRAKPNDAEAWAISRLEAFTASAADVRLLEPLAESIGLPWSEMFPEVLRG